MYQRCRCQNDIKCTGAYQAYGKYVTLTKKKIIQFGVILTGRAKKKEHYLFIVWKNLSG